MVLVKTLTHDIKTGKEKVEEEEVELPEPKPELKGIDLKALEKLIEYAKEQGWI